MSLAYGLGELSGVPVARSFTSRDEDFQGQGFLGGSRVEDNIDRTK
jgi:hypothetical protein